MCFMNFQNFYLLFRGTYKRGGKLCHMLKSRLDTWLRQDGEGVREHKTNQFQIDYKGMEFVRINSLIIESS